MSRGGRVRVRATAGALALTFAVGVAGCGQTQQQRYCAQLNADRAPISSMLNSPDPPAALIAHTPMLRGLSQVAPGDLTAQWQVFLNAVTGLRDALARAGVRPEDFRGGHAPASLRGRARTDVAAAANVLSAPNTVAAVRDIQQQAQDVCKIDLGL